MSKKPPTQQELDAELSHLLAEGFIHAWHDDDGRLRVRLKTAEEIQAEIEGIN